MNVNKSLEILMRFAIIALIAYNVFLSATFVIHNDIGFNTDLARDFLLLQDVQSSHKIPLIGPRSGGISGVFHGPLWLYVNLPVFLLSNGNPVAVGWFWVFLNILMIFVCYIVGKKISGEWTGLLSALLMSSISIPWTSTLFNPFGAVLLSPVFLYFFAKYVNKYTYRNLLISLFVLGLMFQFQVAFAGPILFLTIVCLVPLLAKKGKLKHLSAFFILLFTFSTYILFELRHQFLQVKAILAYVSGNGSKVEAFKLFDFLKNRLDGFINGLVPIQYPSIAVTLILLGLFTYFIYKLITNKKSRTDKFLVLFIYFYTGYWAISFLFKGVIWGYYYWPFIPISVILISSGIKRINRYVFIPLFVIIFLASFNYSHQYISQSISTYIGKDAGSWQFNYILAKEVFSQKDKTLGYYVFSPDEFGYSPRYALDYLAKLNPQVKVSPFKKEPITYLLISAPGGKGNGINGDWWKKNRVKIVKTPAKSWTFENGFRIEKYELSEDERRISSDPNLIDSLFFR